MKPRRSVLSLEHSKVFPLIVQTKKSYQKKIVRSVTQKLVDFCDETNMHGFYYITWKFSTPTERRVWFIIVIVAVIVAISLVLGAKSLNEDNPTVTVIESLLYPSRLIPFPAVTVCNSNKISKSKALTFAAKLKRPNNVTITNENMTKLFLKVLNLNQNQNQHISDYNELNKVVKYNNLTVQSLRNQIKLNCNDMFVKCKWRGILTGCELLFQQINTTEDICCSFNYFGVNTTNYPIKITKQFPKFPRRVTGWSYQSGLTILLDALTNDVFASYFGSYGFQILIHDSYNYPDENAETKSVTASTINLLKIEPESTYTTSDIRDLNPKMRNCYFSGENLLQVMKKYSYINCLLECKSRLFFEKCKCIPFNLPNKNRIPLCEFDKSDCILQSKNNMAGINKTTKTFCNCLPNCESNQYLTEITTAKLIRKYTRDTFFENVKEKDQILVHVYYGDVTSTRYRRDVYQTWVTSLATYGGILALVMGFSIVTVVEFFYYLLINPFINQFKY